MDRLERVLKQGPDRIDEKWISALCINGICSEWAEGLAAAKWDQTVILEALRLAPLIETYFAKGDPNQSATLASDLKTSKLPLNLKLALIRHAAGFPDAPKDAVNGWKRVDFKHPGSTTEFHYFLSVPETYSPRVATPVLVTLHGQKGTADSPRRSWADIAAREGWIMISPEYIYGRKDSYLFSTEEHLSVVEAVRHAARYLNIDADRVYLTGQSQGGHASWDMGAAHAGFFAAVVPIIGANVMPDHLSNYKDTSLYCIDGSDDGKAPEANRRSIEALARMRADATYVEYLGRGHEGFSEEYDLVCDWLRTRQRPPCSKASLFAFRNVERRRRWVEIIGSRTPLMERLTGILSYASAEGQIKPNNQIELKTVNATKLRILLPAGHVDFTKPVFITINGRSAWRGTPQPDWNLTLRECLTQNDRRDIFLAEVLLDVR
jgi:dienelactone hydrolase